MSFSHSPAQPDTLMRSGNDNFTRFQLRRARSKGPILGPPAHSTGLVGSSERARPTARQPWTAPPRDTQDGLGRRPPFAQQGFGLAPLPESSEEGAISICYAMIQQTSTPANSQQGKIRTRPERRGARGRLGRDATAFSAGYPAGFRLAHAAGCSCLKPRAVCRQKFRSSPGP